MYLFIGALLECLTSPPHVRSEHDSVSLAMETQPHDPPVFAPHMRGTCTNRRHGRSLSSKLFAFDFAFGQDGRWCGEGYGAVL